MIYTLNTKISNTWYSSILRFHIFLFVISLYFKLNIAISKNNVKKVLTKLFRHKSIVLCNERILTTYFVILHRLKLISSLAIVVAHQNRVSRTIFLVEHLAFRMSYTSLIQTCLAKDIVSKVSFKENFYFIRERCTEVVFKLMHNLWNILCLMSVLISIRFKVEFPVLHWNVIKIPLNKSFQVD